MKGERKKRLIRRNHLIFDFPLSHTHSLTLLGQIHREMFSLFALVFSLVSLICIVQSASPSIVAPAALSVIAAGPACPLNSFSTSPSTDKRVWTLIFDTATLSKDQNSRSTRISTNCLTTFQVQLPRNSPTEITVSVRGFGSVGSLSKAGINIGFTLNGASFDGAYFDIKPGTGNDFLFTHTWKYSSRSQNSQSRLGISTTLSISGKSSSLVTLDSLDVALKPV